MMTNISYDGTFGAWLTAVFEVYEYKLTDVSFDTDVAFQANVYRNHHKVTFDGAKASRVWKGLAGKVSANALRQLYKAFLSEQRGIELTMLQYVQYAFRSKHGVENDYSNAAVLCITQTAKKVDREKHRMEAFIRFELTGDKLFYAACQPDYNVLPLIEKHFRERYADQRWLIYDMRRTYGIYYDLQTVETVQLTFSEETADGKNTALVMDESEALYQQLWQQYFSSVNIAARKNTKLHLQHMPRRYWKHLTEKQVQG